MKRKSPAANEERAQITRGVSDLSKQQQLDAFYRQEFLVKQASLRSQKRQRFVVLFTVALIIVFMYFFGDLGLK